MPTGWNREMPDKKTQQNQDIPSKSIDDDAVDKVSPEMNKIEMFIPEQPKRTLNDLIVSESVRERIDGALSKIQFHDILYHQWNLKSVDPHGSRTAINLFGSSGTGKTFCAEAIADKLEKQIIKVNYAEIESKYVGETPKNITAAFKKAKETDSVLFFDEADSILGKRLTSVTQSADHGVNVSRSVMLLQLDNFDGVVLFATNLAQNFDPAFVRRILAHIEFELPDKECRVKLWEYLLPKEVPIAEDITHDWLADESDGLAGGYILNVVIGAASRAVQRTGESQKVIRSDITQEILWVKVAKDKIGSPHFAARQVQEKVTIMKPDELPPEVREKYDRHTSESSNSGEQQQES